MLQLLNFYGNSMNILLDENNLAFYIGEAFEVTDEGVLVAGGINTSYTTANTTVIDTTPPEPPIAFVWRWEDSGWVCIDQDAIDAYTASQTALYNSNQAQLRADAYKQESDPVFFKAQREEATMDEWRALVAEIKERYPYK